jgi:hypothetical protein
MNAPVQIRWEESICLEQLFEKLGRKQRDTLEAQGQKHECQLLQAEGQQAVRAAENMRT